MDNNKQKPNDYNDDYIFWKNYRQALYKEIKVQETAKNIPKNAKNIVEMADKIGIKATARYFNINPSSVRYHIKRKDKEQLL